MKTYFAFVLGSGFSGSLLAWILASQGRDTLVVDRGRHPRFAIGESSTPTADFLIAYLAQRWSLPALEPLAAFGAWQANYPQLRCGKKRGFSYFGHRAGESFVDNNGNDSSLLVAASVDDAWSDTHWYRADVDQFLAKQAVEAGATLLESTQLVSALYEPAQGRWRIELNTQCSEQLTAPKRQTVYASWLIDASGFGNGTEAWLGHVADQDWMRTRSGALFGHFDGVASFSQAQPNYRREVLECFDSDDAAQHHVVEDGWYWMLRFQGSRTSVGFVASDGYRMGATERGIDWRQRLHQYPTIEGLMSRSVLVDPREPSGVPTLGVVERMSRCRSTGAGRGWAMMPVTYGFVDPLHSTGIAHSLSGVSRIADALLGPNERIQPSLIDYAGDLRGEIEWIDLLVSGSYRGLPHFARFASFASFYFAASIAFENALAIDPAHWPTGFLSANDQALLASAQRIWRAASQPEWSDASYTAEIRHAIEPWNTAGLLDPKKRNRWNHTAPPKRARLMNPRPTTL